MWLKENLLETFKNSNQLTQIRYWVAKRIFMLCSFVFFLNLFFAWADFSSSFFSWKIFSYTLSFTYTIFVESLFIYIYSVLIYKAFPDKSKLFRICLAIFLFILFIASLIPFLIG